MYPVQRDVKTILSWWLKLIEKWAMEWDTLYAKGKKVEIIKCYQNKAQHLNSLNTKKIILATKSTQNNLSKSLISTTYKWVLVLVTLIVYDYWCGRVWVRKKNVK